MLSDPFYISFVASLEQKENEEKTIKFGSPQVQNQIVDDENTLLSPLLLRLREKSGKQTFVK
ncbi:hypothetical protein ETH_00037320, partial [Eimeria tenella]